MTPFDIIDKFSKGEWEDCFPDPLNYEEFVGFVAEATQHNERGFVVRFEFYEEGQGAYYAWVLFLFDRLVLPSQSAFCHGLYLPNEEIPETMTEKPDECEGVPVFEYEWPLGLDWS